MTIRTYSELIQLPSFEERYQYLQLGGVIGEYTFQAERYLNQAFYRSKEWRKIRREIILRDFGCDLAMEGFDILDLVHVHHMNPITIDDIENYSERLVNPEFLICTSELTHKAIHYANDRFLPKLALSREAGDTKLW